MKTLNIIWIVALLVAGVAMAQDNEDEYMEQAREALNRARYREAAELYEMYRQESYEKERMAEALYWEAFARYRLERTTELKVALELLHQQREYEMNRNLQAESEALAERVAGELARRGEADAVRHVYERDYDQEMRDETKVAALHALMQMDPDKAMPILEKIVRGEDGSSREMRHNAVFMLCREGEGIDIVMEVLPTVEDPELVQAMVMCLSQDDSGRSLDALIDLMRRTDDPEVAQAVLMSLGHHGDERAFDILAEVARDPARDSELRTHALIGLAQSGDARATGIAAEIIRNRDEEPEVMETALMVLAQSDGSAARDVLLDMARDKSLDEELRAQALFMAGHQGHVEAATLKEIYDSTDSVDMKRQICHVLATLDDRDKAFEVLLEIVRNEDDPEIRRDAVFWMGQFDDPRAADFLMEIINEK